MWIGNKKLKTLREAVHVADLLRMDLVILGQQFKSEQQDHQRWYRAAIKRNDIILNLKQQLKEKDEAVVQRLINRLLFREESGISAVNSTKQQGNK